MLTRIKGTQDVLDLTLHLFVLGHMRDHAARYNFQEIITPILEKKELFCRTVGTETDIVTKEMYFVHTAATTDERDDDIVLRPEITASTMRAFLNNSIQTTPWKVFTYGPVFRHERPQKGRYREFNQISLEVIGSASVAGDVSFITMLDRFFSQNLHLKSYGLLINFLGCSDDRTKYKNALREFAHKQTALCDTCIVRRDKNILRVLDCKNETCKEIYSKAYKITDYLCDTCKHEWDLIQKLLHELSVSYSHAPFLVRGLDYYSKVIFEFVSYGQLGAQNTFCAGGRYEAIATEIGSKKDYPSIGAAMGVERIALMLEPIKNTLLKPLKSLHIIIPLEQGQVPLALHIADQLHESDLRVDTLFEGSLKSMLNKADHMQATTVIFVGPEEQAGGYVTVKNMQTGIQTPIKQIQLAQFLAGIHNAIAEHDNKE